MATTRGRVVYTNQVVIDQVDFFEPDGFTRVTGLVIGNLTSELFFNNVLQPWSLTDGSATQDAQVVSGAVLWNEISGSPGFYSIRFRPNAEGYWRLLINYPVGTQITAQDYDVRTQPPLAVPGLRASFVGSSDGCG
jgi:hypothetical protein